MVRGWGLSFRYRGIYSISPVFRHGENTGMGVVWEGVTGGFRHGHGRGWEEPIFVDISILPSNKHCPNKKEALPN